MRKIYLFFISLSLLFTANAQVNDNLLAQQLVTKNADAVGMSKDDLGNYIVSNSYFNDISGTQMVYLNQSYKGLPVYNQMLVLAFREGKLISKAGSFLGNMESLTNASAATPTVTAADAVRTSISDAKVNMPAMIVAVNTLENDKKINFGKLNIAAENVTAELMWVPVDDGKNITAVKLAWQVQLYLEKKPDYWNIRVDANNNTIVNKNNLTVFENFDQFTGKSNNTRLPDFMRVTNATNKKAITNTSPISADNQKDPQPMLSPSLVATANYTVIPYPAESPMHPGGTAAVRTNPWTLAGGNAVSLGWHNDGTADYIYSRGNNVYAQEDRDNNNATFGLPATSTTSPDPLNFTYPINYNVQPITVDFQQFAITNLFYWNNLLHDVTYNYGFTEPAGNFQNNNQGRGGAQTDYVIADAQDAGGTNNANMATPADGARPRMQMYLWDPTRSVTLMNVNTPATIAGPYTAVEGAFSTANLLANVGPRTAQVVYYNDVAVSTHEACVTPSNGAALTGKIALINRGNCNFTVKVKNAQDAGAIAVIMVNNVAGAPVVMGGGPDPTIIIPAVMISDVDGAIIAAQLANNVNVTLSGTPAGTIQLDGDIDNGIVAHEFFHGVSNRLTGGPANPNCLGNAEQGGEGWSDYQALMITTNWATAAITDGATAKPMGNYAFGYPTSGPGIRTYPYSTNLSVNPLTYANLGVGAYASEVHNIGEIWCMSIWELTWALIQTDGINTNFFNANGTGGNTVAYKLVMEGMKLQPCSPGFIDARNGILQADRNLYNGIHACAIWTAFAKRGMGFSAIQGSSNSTTDQTAAFDMPPAPVITAQPAAASVCTGANVTFAVTATGTNLTYQWQLSTTGAGGPWTNITNGGIYSGATTNTLTLTGVTVPLSGNQYRCIIYAACPSVTTNPALLTVGTGVPAITTNPVNTAVCAGSNTSFSVTATGSNLTYQWQLSTTGAGGPWTDITNGGVYSTATTATLTITGATIGMDTYQYRVNVTGGCAATTITSTPAVLSVFAGGTSITSQPVSSAVCAGANTSFAVTATGAGLTYQWQLSTTGAGGPWNNITNGGVYSGATTNTLTLTGVTAVMNTYQYRCIVTGSCPPPLTSSAAMLTVSTGPVITAQPANTTVCVTTNATFSVTATGAAPTYQWQESTTGAGGPWNNIIDGGVYSGALTNTLTLTGVTTGMNAYQYRCVVSGTCPPPATSNAAVLTVVTLSTGGTITPANTVYCTAVNNGTLTLSGAVGNVIRWESATNPAGPWTNITNTTTTLTYTNIPVTTYYRAFVQAAGCAGDYSTIATVQVTALSTMIIVADPGTTICAGDPTRLTASDLSAGGPPSPVSITQSGSNAITPGSVSCGTAITTAVNSFWRVYNLAAFPALTGAFTINTVNFGVESSTGGPQNVTVNLYTQTGAAFPGGTRTQIATQTYSVPNLALASFTATLAAPVTVPNNSVIVVEVATAGAVGTRFYIGSNAAAETGPSYLSATACAINTPTTTTAIGFPNMHILLGLSGTVPGLGPITTGTFLWSPAAGLSSTTSNPVAASPNTTTTYTVTHNNGGGCIRTASITITVNQRPVVTGQPANSSVCSGSTATFTVVGTGTALTYQWQVSTTGPGGPWTNLTNVVPYSGVTTPTLTVTPTTVAMSGNVYRCVLSGICAPVATNNISNGAVLTVVATPTVSISPASPICGGIAGTNGIALTASGATTYVWSPTAGLYINANATTAYTGQNLATVYAAPTVNTVYTVTGTSTATGCSNTATITVNYTPPAPIVNPTSVTMCLGNAAVPMTITSSLAPTTVTFTNNTPLLIPDGPATWPQTVFPGVTSTMPVAGIPAAAVISGISIKLNITHTYIADLVIVLKAPNGNVLNLDANITKTGGAGANFVNTVISSAGVALLSSSLPPYTGIFAPDAVGATYVAAGFTFPGGPTTPAGYIPTVSTFAGLNSIPNGNWSLGIYDWGAGDIGTVTSWTMDITYGLPSTGIWTLNSVGSGNYSGLFADAAATIPYTGTSVQTVYTQPAAAGLYNYYVTVSTGTCTSAGKLVPVTVNAPTAIITTSPNVTLCTDKVATFSVTATGTALTYQWQVSTNGGVSFTDITNGGVYSGATTATLTITAPPVTMNGYQYRVIINGAAPCAAATSTARTLTVNPLPVIVISAGPYTSLFPGLVTTLTSTVSPNPAASFTWLRNGVIVPGANTGTLSVNVDGLGDYQLRVNDVNGCSNVSNTITIKDSVSGRCFIYPNPTSGKFQVRYYSVANNVLPRTLTVYDAKGDRMLTQFYTVGRPYDRMDVDMRAYGKGLYWVEIGDLNGNRITMCRVVIQ